MRIENYSQNIEYIVFHFGQTEFDSIELNIDIAIIHFNQKTICFDLV